MDILNDIFKDTLEREGVNISIGSMVHKVFFRRNDKGNTNAHSTLHALYSDSINQGEVFSINGCKYLITKELTSENLTYRKYECMKCNATIKCMYGKNDMIIYDCYMKDLADLILSKSNIIVLNSKIEIWLPLNADSVMVTIKEKPVVAGDIVVTPAYTASTYYKLLQGRTQTFTCSISGLSNPQWNITLNANGNTASNYISTIDNTNGTVTVYNKLKATPYLIYTIAETTIGKSKTYKIALGGMM